MKRFYKTTLIAAGLLIAGAVTAQDIHFSQFTETPLYRNPALAGLVDGDIRVQGVFRTQWNNVARAYKTTSLNAEYKMPVGGGDDFLTWGVQLFHDQAGTSRLTTTQILPALNFHKSLSTTRSTYLSVGFMGGLAQRRFDRTKITTNNQYDGGSDGESFSQTGYAYLDGSVGMSLNANFSDNPENNLILGAAYHHFNKPKASFFANNNVTLPKKYVFSAGVKFGISDMAYLAVNLDHIEQGSFRESIGGLLYGLKIGPDTDRPDYVLHGGAYMRLNDAVIPTLKLDYRPFSVSLSYDVNISKLKPTSHGRGGFELSLTYISFLDRDNSSLNAVRCPRY